MCGRDEERLRSALAKLEDGGGDVFAQQADVTRAEDVEAFVDAAVARWGRIDGVVHNAGRASAGRLESVGDEEWEADLQLKLMGAVRLTRKALPLLRASRGTVLFTLAMAAKAPGGGSAPSSVSRAAGMALMKALSKELGPDGIRVNAVLVGLVESGQWVPRPRALPDRTWESSTVARPRTPAFRSGVSAGAGSSPTWGASSSRSARPT